MRGLRNMQDIIITQGIYQIIRMINLKKLFSIVGVFFIRTPTGEG